MLVADTDARTVDTDLLMRRIDTGAEFGDQLAVHFHPPIGDHLLAFAAGTESGLCKQLLQANAFLIIVVCLPGTGICVWHRSPNVAYKGFPTFLCSRT